MINYNINSNKEYLKIDFELELNKAIKKKEKEREILFQEITKLKMHVATYKESMKELSKLGVTLPTDQITKTLNKLENITIDTLDTITEEDIETIQTVYKFTTEKVVETEKIIMKELKLAPEEVIEQKTIQSTATVSIVDELDLNQSGLFDALLG